VGEEREREPGKKSAWEKKCRSTYNVLGKKSAKVRTKYVLWYSSGEIKGVSGFAQVFKIWSEYF
jgi:hypothetical protein